jgi:hypothetical protein
MVRSMLLRARLVCVAAVSVVPCSVVVVVIVVVVVFFFFLFEIESSGWL